jgi:hypothetical protein
LESLGDLTEGEIARILFDGFEAISVHVDQLVCGYG